MVKNTLAYPEYKTTNISWLTEAPRHWKVLPGKACFTEKKRLNKGMQETKVLSLSYGNLIVKPEEKLHGLVPESFETYQIVEPGDIIFRTTDLQNDWNSLRFGISRHKGIITSAYMCLKPKSTLINDYGHLLLHSYDLLKIFYGMGSGLRQNIDWRDIKYLPCLVPPLEEQNTIVRFLDYTDRRIKRYIRAKQKLIKLLEEEKQAIIHQAVTRGLNPDVPLKPSGVEGMENIPEHWVVRPLKRVVAINRDTLPERINESKEINYIDIGSVGTGRLIQYPTRMNFRDSPSRARRILNFGDTIISTVRTYLKAIWYVNEDTPNLIASTGFAVLTPSKKIEPEYLSFIIQSKYFIDKVTSNSTGTAYPAISETILGNIKIMFPREINEQLMILNIIKLKNIETDEKIRNFEKEISLLQEYRTRLIADVVTGKLDVREAAAHLPEYLEEEEIDIEEVEPEENDELEEALEP